MAAAARATWLTIRAAVAKIVMTRSSTKLKHPISTILMTVSEMVFVTYIA